MRTFKGKVRWRRLAGAGLLAALSSIALVHSQAQFQIDAPPAAPGIRARQNGNDDSPVPRRLREKIMKMQNEQRQKRLVSDTGKLLALAHELQIEVDKSTGNTSSASALKKAEEIEKLARSVKDKMRAP